MKKSVQKSALKRLSIIEGQIRGLSRMVEGGKYCVDILIQSQAVKKAVSSFEDLILENHLETHVVEQIKSGKEKQSAREIVKLYQLKIK